MEQQPLIELSSISLHETESKNLHDASSFVGLIEERNVETSRGNIHVSVQGTRGKPAFVTFHDIGQNHTSAFLGFFNFHQVRPLLQHFCVYHIDAPGQEEGSPQLAVDYNYPTMDELAELLGEVVDHFALKSFIGFGIGAGANVLSRYALKHPIKVEGLVLVNCVSTTAGWVEWGYQKVFVFLLYITFNLGTKQKALLPRFLFFKPTKFINIYFLVQLTVQNIDEVWSSFW